MEAYKVKLYAGPMRSLDLEVGFSLDRSHLHKILRFFGNSFPSIHPTFLSLKKHQRDYNKMGSDSEYSSLYKYEKPSEIEANFRQTLFKRIDEIEATGSFATGNILDSCPIPGICVDGGEPIALPLSKEAAQNLTRISDKAPFGKRRRTVVDETVRKTLQISAERISF